MIGVGVKKKYAEDIRKKLVKSNLLLQGVGAVKKGDYVVFPIDMEKKKEIKKILEKLCKKEDWKFFDVEFPKKKRIREVDEIISKFSNCSSIGFDKIGDVGIIKLECEDLTKEVLKKIGEEIGKEYKLKSVYLKTSERKGTFRLEELKLIYGEDKPLTLYKENNYKLWVDVKNTYFSPRLANDRKELSEICKGNKEVMVFFSGVAPYVVACAKKCRYAYGIELNENAHKLAQLNIKENKIKNAFVILGDVKKSELLIKQYFLGLKGSWKKEQLETRKEKTKLIEIYLAQGDLEKNYEKIREVVQELIKEEYRVIIHQPHKYKGVRIHIGNIDKEEVVECIEKLNELCEVGCFGYVLHLPEEIEEKEMGNGFKSYLEKIDKKVKEKKYLLKNAYIENSIWSDSNSFYYAIKLCKKHGLNLCVDVSHALIEGYSLEKIKEEINNFPYNVHLHLSYGEKNNTETHATPIPKEHIKRFVEWLQNTKYFSCIIEVVNKDEIKAQEMNEMLKRIEKEKMNIKKFDCILMPLPKDVEGFIDVGIEFLRNGGELYIYKFLGEDINNFVRNVIEIGREKGAKLEFINAKKVGDYAKNVWRWRLCFRRLK